MKSFFILLLTTTVSWAQTAQDNLACRKDASRFCGKMEPNHEPTFFELITCGHKLASHSTSLSHSCYVVLKDKGLI